MFIVIMLMRHMLIGCRKDKAGMGTGPVHAHIAVSDTASCTGSTDVAKI